MLATKKKFWTVCYFKSMCIKIYIDKNFKFHNLIKQASIIKRIILNWSKEIKILKKQYIVQLKKREAFFFNSDIRAGAAIGGRSHLSLSISANCFHENDTFSLAVASLGAASIMSPP